MNSPMPNQLDLPPTTADPQRLMDGVVAPDDVRGLYLLMLAREPDAEPQLLERACGRALRDFVLEIACCEEIAVRVLQALAQDLPLPHSGMSPEQASHVERWLDGMEPGKAANRPAAWAAWLARVLDHGSVRQAMVVAHGLVLSAARAKLGALCDAPQFVGKIEFVNREFIYGWAVEVGSEPGPPLQLELRHDGRLLAVATAWSIRPDIAQRYPGRAQAGFRARWRPELLPAEAPIELELVEAKTKRRIGTGYRFSNSFVEQLSVAQLLAKEIEELKQRMDKLAAMVPQALSYAAFAPEHFDLYRRSHRVPPPPGLDPRNKPLAKPLRLRRFVILIDGQGDAADPIDLRRSIDSLRSQHVCAWRAVVVCEPGPVADTMALLRAADARVAGCRTWSEAVSSTLQGGDEADVDWVVLMRAGETLDAHALGWIAQAVDACRCVAVYWDEDAVQAAGDGPAARHARHVTPTLRAPFDPDAQLEWNGVGDSFAVAGTALAQALHDLSEVERCGLHPLALERRERLIWALQRRGVLQHVPQFLLTAPLRQEGQARWVAAEGEEALRGLLPHAWEHCDWERVGDPLSDAAPKGLVRWRPRRPDSVISVLIPTRDQGMLLQQCIDSLLSTAECAGSLDIVVADNGSADPPTLRYLGDAQARGQIRVLRIDEPFNWSRLNNLMVAASRGQQLLFLNNDTRMLTSGWDSVLRGLLERPDVGLVGARLLYEDLTIQHAGIAFGVEDFVGHHGVATAHDAPAALASTQLSRRVPAVTGAFLACTRASFDILGGFEEHRLTVAYNDVEWCLRASKHLPDRHTLYAPLLSLVHYESKSRGFDFQDAAKQRRADYERRALLPYADDIARASSLHPRASRWLNQSEGFQ